nr:hypothetical protein [Tanacetum cinerariifolium]
MEMENTMHLLITSYLKVVAHQSCRGYQCVRSTCSVKKSTPAAQYLGKAHMVQGKASDEMCKVYDKDAFTS